MGTFVIFEKLTLVHERPHYGWKFAQFGHPDRNLVTASHLIMDPTHV
jgi:hypothetical protein